MLISQVRETLKQYKEEDLRLLLAEIYKSIPKKIREDKDIDDMINDLHAYKSIGKNAREADGKKGIEEIKPKIELFIDYAYEGYYFAPNKNIHKKERPKWRFQVKAFIKDLESIPAIGKEGREATNLLRRIYEMLCYACHTYLFNSDNPFRAVGIQQSALLEKVISRMLEGGVSDECIKSAIELFINNDIYRGELDLELVITVANQMKTTDAKEIAISQCKLIKKELIAGQAKGSKKTSHTYYGDDKFRMTEKRNNLTKLIFMIYLNLYENEKAIKYFQSNYIERDKERTQAFLLHYLMQCECMPDWIKEYEQGLEKGMEFKESYQREYQYIMENQSFSGTWL